MDNNTHHIGIGQNKQIKGNEYKKMHKIQGPLTYTFRNPIKILIWKI